MRLASLKNSVGLLNRFQVLCAMQVCFAKMEELFGSETLHVPREGGGGDGGCDPAEGKVRGLHSVGNEGDGNLRRLPPPVVTNITSSCAPSALSSPCVLEASLHLAVQVIHACISSTFDGGFLK